MDPTMDEFESDWVHAVFGAFRDEAVSLAADFGTRVKNEIDSVAATQEVRPPSATSLLASVVIESGNIAADLIHPGSESDSDEERDDD